jgi:hypothetical protein
MIYEAILFCVRVRSPAFFLTATTFWGEKEKAKNNVPRTLKFITVVRCHTPRGTPR